MKDNKHLSDIDLSKCIYPYETKNKKYLLDKDPVEYANTYVKENMEDKIQKIVSDKVWDYHMRTNEITSINVIYEDTIQELTEQFLSRDSFLQKYQNDGGVIKEDIRQYEKTEEIEIDR